MTELINDRINSKISFREHLYPYETILIVCSTIKLERVLISTNASPSTHAKTQHHYYFGKFYLIQLMVLKFQKSFPLV